MPTTLRFLGAGWFQILAVGSLLFLGTEQALKYTGEPGFITATIMLGAFVVPAAFVSYFNSREHALDRGIHRELPQSLLVSCFLVGGAMGVIIAGVLEYETLRTLHVQGLFGVGFIEEAAKLVVPIVIFVRAGYRSESDGILFGVAAGMGFAALMNSKGNVGLMEETVLVRGLLSPVGHASWTGFVCAVMWRRRELTGKLFSWWAVWAFVLAAVLHASWDIASGANAEWVIFISYVAIGGASLVLLLLRVREAARSGRSKTELSTAAAQ